MELLISESWVLWTSAFSNCIACGEERRGEGGRGGNVSQKRKTGRKGLEKEDERKMENRRG